MLRAVLADSCSMSVCLSTVRHTPVLCQNERACPHSLHDVSMFLQGLTQDVEARDGDETFVWRRDRDVKTHVVMIAVVKLIVTNNSLISPGFGAKGHDLKKPKASRRDQDARRR